MAIHVNMNRPMQLMLLIMEIILAVTIHVLLYQDQSHQTLPFLLAIITTVNLELEVFIVVKHIMAYPTHCGTVQVVLLTTHVVLTLNHGSIIS